MTIRLDKGLYSKQVLLKTAFSFTDRVYIHLEQNQDEWIISWKVKGDTEINAEEFENELISQQLRETIVSQATDLRKLLLARAFASSVLEKDEDAGREEKSKMEQIQESSGETEDERILKGWFES